MIAVTAKNHLRFVLLVTILILSFILPPISLIKASDSSISTLNERLPATLVGSAAIMDLNNGYGYVFGGSDASSPKNSILKFNPSTGSITTTQATLPRAVTDMSAVFDGQYAYVFSGWYSGTQLASGLIVRYDPSTDSIKTMQTSLSIWSMSAVWAGNYAYLFGGWDGYSYKDTILRYDPSSDQLVTMNAHLPVGLKWHSAVWTGNYAYIFGGSRDYDTPTDTIYRYDPTSDTLTTLSTRLPAALEFTSAVWTGTYAYIFGGAPLDSDKIFRFNPSDNSVTTASDALPTARSFTSAIWDGNAAYIFGGQNQVTHPTTLYSDIVKYLPSQDSGTSTQGLVGYWKFDEGVGDIAHDSSGNLNDGTIMGAQWVSGISGFALKFTDSNSNVQMARFPDGISDSSKFTVSFCVKIDSWPSGYYAYLVSFGNGGDSIYDVAFHVLLDNNSIEPYGTVRASFWNRHAYTSHTFTTGIWYDWTFVYDGAQILMYQNGTLLESIGLAGGSPHYDKSGPVKLSSPSSQFFQGTIDNLAIYNYTRSANDIYNDYVNTVNSAALTPTYSPSATATPYPAASSTLSPIPSQTEPAGMNKPYLAKFLASNGLTILAIVLLFASGTAYVVVSRDMRKRGDKLVLKATTLLKENKSIEGVNNYARAYLSFVKAKLENKATSALKSYERLFRMLTLQAAFKNDANSIDGLSHIQERFLKEIQKRKSSSNAQLQNILSLSTLISKAKTTDVEYLTNAAIIAPEFQKAFLSFLNVDQITVQELSHKLGYSPEITKALLIKNINQQNVKGYLTTDESKYISAKYIQDLLENRFSSS
jgi:hypothetical protein